MKIIKDEAILEKFGPSALCKIEKIARTCYKSEELIKEGSAEKMVRGLKARGHEAMLEHVTYIFGSTAEGYYSFWNFTSKLQDDGFDCMIRRTARDNRYIISGNVRAWRELIRACGSIEGGIPRVIHDVAYSEGERRVFFDDLGCTSIISDDYDFVSLQPEDLTPFEKGVHYDITAKFICDRGISHEIVRHRKASFAQESTRYANYSLGKFGGEIAVISPEFTGADEGSWSGAMLYAETAYLNLLESGQKPQMARSVLPNSLKTEIYVTASVNEWRHIFNLRALDKTGPAHPQIKKIMKPLLADMKVDEPKCFGDLYE